MFCPNCGHSAADDDAFCRECGYDLSARLATEPPDETAAEPPAVAEPPVAAPVAEPPTVEPPAVEPALSEPAVAAPMVETVPEPSVEPTVAEPAVAGPIVDNAATPPPGNALERVPVAALWAIVGLGVVALIVGFTQLGGGGEAVSTDVAPPGPEAVAAGAVDPGSGPAPGPQVSSSPFGGTGAAAGTTRCSNAFYGYALSYPSDWYTQSHRARQDCRFFSSVPLDFGPQEKFPTAEIVVVPTRSDYQSVVDSLDQGEIVSTARRDLTIGGYPAVGVGYAFTGSDEGANYAYIVNIDGVAFILDARSQDSADFAATRAVMDALVASVEFS